MAAIVATAKMDGERDTVATRGLEASIVGFHGIVERSIRIQPHFIANPFAPLRIHVIAVTRRIDLDVADSIAGEMRKIGLHDFNDGPEKFGTISVNGVRDSGFESDRRELRRA